MVFSDAIEVIPCGAIQMYRDLEEIVWPKALKVIERESFLECSSLRELIFPEGLEVIGENVFQEAEVVKKVCIPASIREIGSGSFYFGYGSHLLNIDVDKNNQHYCDVDGVLYTKDMKTLIKYPSARRKANVGNAMRPTVRISS